MVKRVVKVNHTSKLDSNTLIKMLNEADTKFAYVNKMTSDQIQERFGYEYARKMQASRTNENNNEG